MEHLIIFARSILIRESTARIGKMANWQNGEFSNGDLFYFAGFPFAIFWTVYFILNVMKI